MQTSCVTDIEASRFDQCLQMFWQALRSLEPALPAEADDGVGEYPASPWPVSYALDRKGRFAAFRWFQQIGSKVSAFEWFFLCPSSSTPKTGIKVFGAETTGLSLPLWWSEGLGLSCQRQENAVLPGFIELVALLSSGGDVVTTSAEMRVELAGMEHDLAYYRSLSDEQAEELRTARTKVRDLLARPIGATPQGEEDGVSAQPAPITDLSGLPDWAMEHSDKIVILPRALNSAKKSIYEQPAAVYGALELLAGAYREHRLGSIDREAFMVELNRSGLQLDGSVAPSVAGEQGDAYFVSWGKRRRFLDLHLVKGGGRDERYCLRVYFFWDADLKKAVVGWLPSHLSNSLS